MTINESLKQVLRAIDSCRRNVEKHKEDIENSKSDEEKVALMSFIVNDVSQLPSQCRLDTLVKNAYRSTKSS